jgi:hypothetical protein
MPSTSDLEAFINASENTVNPSVGTALRDQASAIWKAYVEGNKSTARVMFSQVRHERKAYVTMWLMGVAANDEEFQKVVQFILSVTK